MAEQLNDHAARSHALLSASSSARWLACTPSAVIAARYPSTSTAYTREGTVAHEVAEVIASGGLVTVGDGITEEMIRCAENYRDYIQGLCRPETVMLLEQRLDMTPWVPDGFGTGDCILLTGDVMDVIDYKYGQGVPVSAEKNSQLMLYGLGAMNEYGFIYDVKIVRLHIFQPRISNISVYVLTVDELLEFGGKVKEQAAIAARGEGDLSAGDHCRFCPHAGRCPELAMQCIWATDDGKGSLVRDVDTMGPSGVAAALKLAPLISVWLKKLNERALADMLNGEEVPGFKVVEGKQGNRKWKDELAVATALDAAGISREDYTTVQLLSPAAMDKALGKKKAAELLSGLIERAPGAPTVVPSSDKRPPYEKCNASDFIDI